LTHDSGVALGIIGAVVSAIGIFLGFKGILGLIPSMKILAGIGNVLGFLGILLSIAPILNG
jgi:hypothetical protein